MPTGAELKAQINAGITSQTEAGSITMGSEIGQPMEDIVDYVDQEIANLPTSGGLTSVSHNDQLRGDGTVGNPLALKYYERTGMLYAGGGPGMPTRYKNFFTGMELPTGITETFSNEDVGKFIVTYSGDIGISYLDITSATNLFLIKFWNNPNMKITEISNSTAGSTRNLIARFEHTVDEVLTNAFTMTGYEVRFY